MAARRARVTERYGAGEVILFPGAPGNLYRVREGLVRVHTVDDEGRGLTLRYVKPGGFFGEEALSGDERRYFAEAMTEVVLESKLPAALTAAERRALAEHLAKAMSGLYRALTRLSGKRLKARVAAELLELCESPLAQKDEGERVVVRLTHDDLASAVGSVRETVTKVIGELAREGVIEAGYGRVTLIDAKALRRHANE